MIKVCCIGFGQRGFVYLSEMNKLKDRFEIVSICDKNQNRLDNASKIFNLSPKNLFLDEDEFFKQKRADLCVVSTQDRDHVGHCIKALKAGYDILCEKPISGDEKEIRKLYNEQKRTNKKIIVCHVLRYAPAFKKVKELLDSNVIGQLVMIDGTENIGYSHFAHSYVRGNWRNLEVASPSILAKSCHDLDLMVMYAGSRCEYLSSFGELNYYTNKNMPIDAKDRCLGCKYQGQCPYDAYDLYINKKFWGRNMVSDVYPVTDEAIKDALDKGPYGRCVFKCDNNVVDNQIINMKFENGITANFKMTAFVGHGGRIYKFYGTKGQINLNESNGYIDIKIFGKEVERINISTLVDAVNGHGGGDEGIVKELYQILTTGDVYSSSTLEASIESHLMCFAAEQSRLNDGEIVFINHY